MIDCTRSALRVYFDGQVLRGSVRDMSWWFLLDAVVGHLVRLSGVHVQINAIEENGVDLILRHIPCEAVVQFFQEHYLPTLRKYMRGPILDAFEAIRFECTECVTGLRPRP